MFSLLSHQNFSNTYTFTKRLTEITLIRERGDLPMIIVRPASIVSSLQEPQPGWIDNINGATGKSML